jgi:hypothetical protein
VYGYRISGKFDINSHIKFFFKSDKNETLLKKRPTNALVIYLFSLIYLRLPVSVVI